MAETTPPDQSSSPPPQQQGDVSDWLPRSTSAAAVGGGGGGELSSLNATTTTITTVNIPLIVEAPCNSPSLLTEHALDVEMEQVQRTVRSVLELRQAFQRRNERAIELAWHDISVTSMDGQKTLLTGATGSVKARFLAIMGPSGSGKTTLMNVLACRMSNVKKDGHAKINGIPYSNTQLKAVSGYVMQDDLLNGNFTVQETLHYAAELRLPSTMSKEEKVERVEEAMTQLGIGHVRNVIIGTPMKKGVSGGERKRVCVAMELLTHPRLLFLDEPTSGLDSVTAYSLTKSLKELASSGACTVVCTIHQPQTKIFDMFDDLLLLKSGKIVYYGKAKETVNFFAAAGFPCPAYTNPADHFLDVISPPVNKTGEPSHYHDADAKLISMSKEVAQSTADVVHHQKLEAIDRPSWWHQFTVLFERSMKESLRSYNVLITLYAQNIIMALLIGGAFFQIGTSLESATKRSPVLFFTVINQGVFAALSIINSFPSERMLMLRERAAGTYNASAYFLAKNLAESLLQILGPVIFSCIAYWMVGFQPTAAKFFIYTGFMILNFMTAVSFALVVSALARTTTLSVTILPLILEVARLFGGFFLSPANLPKYFVWLDALSYVKYAYIGISLNELDGLVLSCSDAQKGQPAINQNCTGEGTMGKLGLNAFTMGECAGVLVAMIIGCRFIAYLGVRYIKW